MRKILVHIGYIICVILFPFILKGQCPEALFNLSNNACSLETVVLENQSTNSITYEWDFCEGDLFNSPNVSVLTNISSGNSTRGIEILFSDEEWFGFVTSRDNNSIFRLKFGANINNTSPVIENLGNIQNLLDGPEPIKFLKEANNWYGLVHNGKNETLIKLDFGDNLSNTPSASLILNNIGAVNTRMDIGSSNDSTIVIFTNFQSNTITQVNFGNTIENIPSTGDVITSSSPDNTLFDISLFNQCGNWYGSAVSLFSKETYLLDFGTSLFSAPSFLKIGSKIYGAESPASIEFGVDKGQYMLNIMTQQGGLYLVNLGPDLSNPTSLISNYGNFGIVNFTLNHDLVKDKSNWYGFAIDFATRKLFRYDYVNSCDANIESSSLENISNLYFTAAGTKSISLKASRDGFSSYNSQEIIITSDIAPDIAFNSIGNCQNNTVSFLNENASGNIISYLWSFGDTSTSTDPNPLHIYSAPGDYEVNLQVQSVEGCVNRITKTVAIFTEPDPSFLAPSGSICTNSLLFFENTTAGDFDNNETWEWQVNGMTVSTSKDLDYNFTDPGATVIKLIASIPGCSNEIIINTTINEGPTPNFSVIEGCASEAIQFTNQSSGTITAYLWDFGNGFTSTNESPLYQYPAPGTFDVTLTIDDNTGCRALISKSVTIDAIPDVRFAADLACAGNITQFTDLTTIANANIAKWEWSFDDENSLENGSFNQNPNHIFQATGNYNVKLIVTSNFGCKDSVEQIISVLATPEANFSYSNNCIFEPVQFQDLSIPSMGEEIRAWTWNIGGTFSDSKNPSIVFNIPGDYSVNLTVVSENNCSSSFTEVISVQPLAIVEFDTDASCDGAPIHFYDKTEALGNKIISWRWDFGSMGIASDSSVFVSFPNDGSFPVSLSITTSNGCTYIQNKDIVVDKSPIASYQVPVETGGTPLKLPFTNTSILANNYFWDFGDGNFSNDQNPNHTFTTNGNYEVILIASNDGGCQDTIVKSISAISPIQDISINAIEELSSSKESRIKVSFSNKGNVLIDSLKIIIDVGNEVKIIETIRTELLPSGNAEHTLISAFNYEASNYVCITIEPLSILIVDQDLSNNTLCLNSIKPFAIEPPYPNPASDHITLKLVSDKSTSVEFALFNAAGEVVRKLIEKNLKSGMTELTLLTSDLNDGIYLLRIINGENIEKTFKILIEK